MIHINPQSLGLLTAATSGIISALPKGQLARFGLMRAPVAAPLAISPLAATAGGVLAVALTIPSSRRWILSKATALTTAVRSRLMPNSNSGDDQPDAVSAKPANRQVKPQRAKDHPSDAARVLG